MFEFELPDVGEGVAEGEIVAWHVEPGDRVEEDQVLAEVETDKAVVDLPSPVAGTVSELHAEAGDIVPVGDVVVTIDTDGDAGAAGETGAADETATDETAADEMAAGETAATGDDRGAGGGEDGAAGTGQVFAAPRVRRLARELGVDIGSVEGSGPGGRVTEADVRGAAESREDADSEPAVTRADSADGAEPKPAVRRVGDGEAAADRDRTLATPATRRLAREAGVDIDEVPTDRRRDGEAYVEPEDVEAYVEAREAAETAAEPTTGTGTAGAAPGATGGTGGATGDAEAVTTEPYRGVRRTIGRKMAESAFTAPHACHHDTAVVDDLVETRAELKPRAEERGVRLTYLPFVVKAVVAGLAEYPVLNTELDEEAEEIQYKHYYNVGVAVATEAGLMVPVVEDADAKGLLEIASEANDLAERARSRDLAPDEMQGGTFTVTNFGAVGGEYATPIINHPETAILGLGAIEQRPVAVEGEVVARHTLPLSLSIDHRVIDGAEAAGFVNTVIEYLENPSLLLL
jgi:pyruvate dehydrogenase E2 component (dihydrolipoamide acetyltransferase)